MTTLTSDEVRRRTGRLGIEPLSIWIGWARKPSEVWWGCGAAMGWIGVDPDGDLGDKCGGGGRDKSLDFRVCPK